MTPRKPAMPPKKNLKEKILQVITENFMKMILDMVKQNVQDHSRNFKTPKVKNTKNTETNK
jgi:hypothetical protein